MGPSPIDLLAENDMAEELMQYEPGEHIFVLTVPYKVVRPDFSLSTGWKVVDIDHYVEYSIEIQQKYSE